MAHATRDPLRHPRPLDLAATAATGVLAGGLLGAITNAVNGRISPTYFVNVLGWQGVEDVWRASIAQGAFEGLLFGVFFSLVFATVTGIITGAACPYGFAVRHLLGILGGALTCWALGGLLAVALAALSPEFYRRAFRGARGGRADAPLRLGRRLDLGHRAGRHALGDARPRRPPRRLEAAGRWGGPRHILTRISRCPLLGLPDHRGGRPPAVRAPRGRRLRPGTPVV
jgi:hypothetical protein